MTRREVILRIGGAVVTTAFLRSMTQAQPSAKVWRIGMLETISRDLNAANLNSFRKGMSGHGYVEGRNYVLDYRSAEGDAERFTQLAAELVRARVDLIVTRGTPAAQAAKAATATIPVVMASIGEPLGAGVVAGLARPGGNITGLSAFTTELAGKRVQLVREMLPGLTRLALLHNMGNPVAPPQWEETKIAAQAFGLEATLLDVRNHSDIGRAFETAVSSRIGLVLVGVDGLIQAHRQLIIDLAVGNKLPVVYSSREFVEAGGLMAYGVSYPDLYFRAAGLVDKILRGARPADLPVEQPTKFELIVNLKTAKALGLIIVDSFLLRADEVIE